MEKEKQGLGVKGPIMNEEKVREDAVYAELLLGKALGKPYLEAAEIVMRKYDIDRPALDRMILRASNRRLERLQQAKGE
jgi:hypothetical protein